MQELDSLLYAVNELKLSDKAQLNKLASDIEALIANLDGDVAPETEPTAAETNEPVIDEFARGLEDLTNGNLPPAPEADGASLTGGAWAPNAVTVEVSKEDFSDITDAEADAIVAHIKAGTLGTAADITELTRVVSGATMRVKFAIDDIKIPTGMFVQALFTWSAEVEVDGVSAPVLAQVPYLFVPRAVEQAQVMGLRAMIEAGALYGDEDDLGW